MDYIVEPQHEIPVVGEFDLCVIGGSCTGVFAAVRAARQGLRVAIVECNTMLGGTAAAAWVSEWHSTYGTDNETKIIGGLLDEVIHGLRKRDAVQELAREERTQYRFNAASLACELDRLVLENGVQIYLETRFSLPVMDGQRISAVIVEDKAGRRAIKARTFIDGSGDAALVRRVGFDALQHDPLQPAAYQTLAVGIDAIQQAYPGVDIWNEVRGLAAKYGFPESNPWIHHLVGAKGVNMIYGARLNGVDASIPMDLTQALMEGRRIGQAYLDMIRERFPEAGKDVALVAVAPMLGVRETWHACCLHRLTSDELLSGEHFPDTIANGTYPVDVHHPGGTKLLYLDGRETEVYPGGEIVWRRWKPEDAPTPLCYHIPYRSLVPLGAENLLVAGRCIDADRDAYGAIRVMVNCNQMGEAAGVAAALAVDGNLPVADVPPQVLRQILANGESVILDL